VHVRLGNAGREVAHVDGERRIKLRQLQATIIAAQRSAQTAAKVQGSAGLEQPPDKNSTMAYLQQDQALNNSKPNITAACWKQQALPLQQDSPTVQHCLCRFSIKYSTVQLVEPTP
jgi:hypothetical protein